MLPYQKLKRIREQANISQAKIAEVSGLTQATVSAFERGTAQSIKNLEGYATAVGARLRYDTSGWTVESEAPAPTPQPEPTPEPESNTDFEPETPEEW